MSISIDIKARIFSSKDSVYRLFPGKSYRHYKTMRDHSVVFLDYPGIGLPGLDGYDRDEHFLERLARSEQKARVVRATNQSIYSQLQEIDHSDLLDLKWTKNETCLDGG